MSAPSCGLFQPRAARRSLARFTDAHQEEMGAAKPIPFFSFSNNCSNGLQIL